MASWNDKLICISSLKISDENINLTNSGLIIIISIVAMCLTSVGFRNFTVAIIDQQLVC